jgi:diaminohydroxyphosphoribosylaminopyrimidine deaminase / 5-amino-6-(5-phosphoribosylamino)uracil reductase
LTAQVSVSVRASHDDRALVGEAIRLAARVPRRPWPNPPVGALVVRDDGTVVGRGWHEGPGTRHAEAVALDEAGSAARGATLFCTLEPCNHQGRTPPCAPRVASSGVRRVVVGVRDPNPSVGGGGIGVLQRAGVEVTIGVCAEACTELVWPFVATGAFARPYVLLKTATSIDGRFGPRRDTGSAPVYLTAAAARHDVHVLRRWADLVLVGAQTILSDRPRLDGRLATADDDCPAAEPVPGYVDTDLSADLPWPGRPHVVFAGCRSAPPSRRRAIEAAGGRVVCCDERDGRVLPGALLDGLRGLGIHTLLLEGGPTLARSFLAAGLVDRWVSYVAPSFLAGGVGWPPAPDDPGTGDGPPFHVTSCDRVGGDARLVFDRVPFLDTVRRLSALEA